MPDRDGKGLVRSAKINTLKSAEWNISEKSVKIFLEDGQWEEAEKLQFDTKWAFIFIRK